ncbi:MAG: putative two-component response regulator [Actinomycetia bacterium]|nr:putative two-component response regulator [Actinomycetes bacterium]
MPCVLVVDDDADIRELIARMLRQARYEVRTATDGETALASMLLVVPDLVILDIAMPRRTGLEVLQVLRARRETAVTPVIVVTARASAQDVEQGFRVGADDYVIKPFRVPELMSRVLATVGPAH